MARIVEPVAIIEMSFESFKMSVTFNKYKSVVLLVPFQTSSYVMPLKMMLEKKLKSNTL